MALICPQCSQSNPDQSGFCVRCGTRLQSGTSPSTGLPASSYTGTLAAATERASYSTPTYAPPPPPTPPGQALTPGYAAYPPSSSAYTPSFQQPVQMGTGQGLASLRRAFAGYGTQIKLHSWLLPGQHTHAIPVLSAVNTMLGQRNIFGLNFRPDKLSERGLTMESRDYLVVRRGAATVFVYTAPAGKDLYISRATTVQPAINQFRVVILLIVAFLLLFGPFILSNALSNAASTSPYSPFASSSYTPLLLIALVFVLAYIPLLLSLIWLIILSIVNWVLDKDLWVYLRPNVLNSFQLDDVALLELETDGIVRDSLQQLGLDASLITPPTQGYEPKRKIRAI